MVRRIERVMPGFMIHLDSRLLSRLRRPIGTFNTELLGVLRVQPLPVSELHRLRADHAAERRSAEKVIQDIETNMPPGSTHGDEAVADVGPQRQARTAANWLELPSHVKAAPFVLQRVGRVGSRHCCFGNVQRGRSDGGELYRGSSRTQAPIRVEGCPLTQMCRV